MQLRPSGIVTLCTDFGRQDPYVGIMEGALRKASPKVSVVHITHAVPPQDVAAGSFHLATLIGRFPEGSVHVGVVDPGVGTERRLLAVAALGSYWIVPDNGLIGSVLAAAGEAEVRVLDLAKLGLVPESATFHGRDVFAPVAAWLATGRYGYSALGPRCDDCDDRDLVYGGEPRVVHIDRFGNLITNVRAAAVAACAATSVLLGDVEVALRSTYGDVADGELLAYVGSFGLLEIARRNGRAADGGGMQLGASIRLTGA